MRRRAALLVKKERDARAKGSRVFTGNSGNQAVDKHTHTG